MRYYIIAGEASGDLHASNLMASISKLDSKPCFRCWGGDLMQKEGGEIVKHYRDLAFMGFVEVLMNIRTISKNLKFCKNDILEYKPDTLILVDYPGFNLRIADFAKQNGIKVLYYISPQVWAWKEGRVKKIKRIVDKMYCILPFEKEFYKNHDYDVEYVGHPLLDEILKPNTFSKEAFLAKHNLSQKPIVALLPGSRKQEISKMLGQMLEVIPHFEDYQFVVAGAPSQTKEFYSSVLPSHVKLIENETYDLLKCSEAALVTSGTATLETGLHKVPQVVCYKGSWISYQIAKRVIKVDYISLVNLILNKPAVAELIQSEFNVDNLVVELKSILPKGSKRSTLEKDYSVMSELLGGGGASDKAAKLMLAEIQ